MSFSFYISKRYIFSKKDSKFISFISGISITGIALGVATLIIALSILNGFENTITNKIIDFDSHIQISSFTETLPDYHYALPILKNKIQPYAVSINPFVSKLAIISSRTIKDGVSIKGIRSEDYWKGVKEDIVNGKFNLYDDENLPAIIIGKKLADKLMVKVGDRVTVFALNKDQIPSAQNPPNIQRFIITGIFESGMAAFDDLVAYVDIKTAQRLFNIGNYISGYDIRVNNISKIDSLTNYLTDHLSYPYATRSIYQIHRNIFTWIALQKKPIPIILGLIIIVAVFNIIGTLLMIVLEKTNAIGILKSLGANRRQIISVFIYQGIYLAITGILIGNIIAFTLTYLQFKYKIISIPSSVYFMSTVPILFSYQDFIGVSVLTFLLCIISSFVPSYIASKVQPVSTLRFG
ncbi:MAG: ABC transporter permease [Bacteroidetes bacterium]|nr:ABC transporter permease [Bacteroidota bacterium]